MAFKVITTPFPAWDAFCKQHSGLLFHQEKWRQVVQTGLRYPCMYCTLWEGEKLIMGVPTFLMNYKIVKVLYASIPYGTILGDYQRLPEFLPALHDFVAAHKIDLLQLGGGYPGTPPFDMPRYVSGSHPIHLLSLREKSASALWQSYKRYVRRDIRKAARMGVVVEEIQARSEVEDFYTLYVCSMRRNKTIAKYPKRFMYAIYDLIITQGYGDIFFAKLGSEKIAGIMVLYSRDIAHYYFGGSRHEYHRYQPNEALLHTALCRAINLGKSTFDFMGSDSRDINLIHFKEKWGATSYPMLHYTASRNRFRAALWHAGTHFLTSAGGAMLARCVQQVYTALALHRKETVRSDDER